jgi:hypothetical protein
MTTPKQILANRSNGRRSKGPRTARGKARSRLNAVTHGLTAKTLILAGVEEPEYQRRRAAWRAELAPCNPYEEELVRQAVSLSWRLDRADRVQATLLADWITNGPAEEERRRREEVEDLASRLWPDPSSPDPPGDQAARGQRLWPVSSDDPDDPARLVSGLERTAEGCRWLLERWAGLRAAVVRGLAWSPAQMLGAIRLLGHWPLAAFADRGVLELILDCATLDGGRPDPFAALWEGLAPAQAESYRDRLRGRGIEAAMSPTGEQARRRLLERIDETVEPLEEREAMLRERDALGRAGRRLFDDSPEAEWLRREQARATRGVLRIVERFRVARRRGEVLSPKPPARRPADRPARGPEGSFDPGQPRGPNPDAPDVPARAVIDPDSGLAPFDRPDEPWRAVGPAGWPVAVERDPWTPDPNSPRIPGAGRERSSGPSGSPECRVPAIRPHPGAPPAAPARPQSSNLRPTIVECSRKTGDSPLPLGLAAVTIAASGWWVHWRCSFRSLRPTDRRSTRPRPTGRRRPLARPLRRRGRSTPRLNDRPTSRAWNHRRRPSPPALDPEIDKTNPFPRRPEPENDKTNPISGRSPHPSASDSRLPADRRTVPADRRDASTPLHSPSGCPP